MSPTDDQAPWGADVPISMPEPPAIDAGEIVSFGGLGFTAGGLIHDLSEVDREAMLAQAWGPAGGGETGG